MGHLRSNALMMVLGGLSISGGCETPRGTVAAPYGSCQPAPERLAELGCVEVRFAPSRGEAARACSQGQRFVEHAPCPRDHSTLLVCNEQVLGTSALTALYYYDAGASASRDQQQALSAERCARMGGTQGALPAPAEGVTSESNPSGEVRLERLRRDLLRKRASRIHALALLSWKHWVAEPAERFATRRLGALLEGQEPRVAELEKGGRR